MRLSRASRYALHALAFLANQPREQPVSTKVISSATGIPNVFLLKALKPCVSQRLLDSITGPNGGYRLAKKADEISVLQIIEAVDGPIMPHPFANVQNGNTQAVDQQLEKLLAEATNRQRDVYSAMTIAQLGAKKRK